MLKRFPFLLSLPVCPDARTRGVRTESTRQETAVIYQLWACTGANKTALSSPLTPSMQHRIQTTLSSKASILLLTFLFGACSAGTKAVPSSGDTSGQGICAEQINFEGTWFLEWPHCHQSEPLEEMCDTAFIFDWWNEESCPTFERYATYVLNHSNNYYPDAIWVGRCTVGGLPYDMIEVGRTNVDSGSVYRSYFSISGELVSHQNWSWFMQTSTPDCCEGHQVEGLSWGERIELDCTNATLYTVEDFPDSADTATDTATDTGPTDTDTADTADTGAQ